MGFIDFFANLFKTSKSLPSSLNGFNVYQIGTNMEIYPTIDIQKAVDIGYQGDTDVFSIVSKASKKFAAIPRSLQLPDGTDAPINNKNIQLLNKLLNSPNSYQGQDSYLEHLYTYKQICGEAFIFLNRGDILGNDGKLLPDDIIDKMPILETIVLPSNYMLLIPDPYDMWGILGYRMRANGIKVDFRKNDILHWRNVNLDFDPINRTHLRGLSPLTPGYRALQSNNSATDATVRMHQQDGAKGIIYQDTKEPFEVTPDQMTQIRSALREKVNNTDAKGSVATLAGKWGYLNLTSSIDMNLLESRKYSCQQLCNLFDIPYQLFDSQTTFSNTEWAQKNWISNTIVPAAKSFDDELNRSLLKAFQLEGIVVIISDPTGLAELQKDLNYLTQALGVATWLTMNEKREAMGYDPLPDPSFDQPWIPAGPLPLNEISDELSTQKQMTQSLNDQSQIAPTK